MSNVSKIGDVVSQTTDQKEMLISFWGLGCVSGNQYSQVIVRRFRLTKAVLDPDSYSKDEKTKIVKVKVIHRGCDYLLCVLKHDEIFQVSLNLMFDKGEKVTFYAEGHGKVYLSGYEVNDTVSAIPWDESVTIDLVKDVKTSSPKRSTPIQSSKSKTEAESRKSDRKAKSIANVTPDETILSPKPYLSMLFNGEMNENNGDDDDEDDDDFCVADEEVESDEESEDEEIDERSLEEEVQVLEAEIKEINEDDDDEGNNDNEEEGEEDEDEEEVEEIKNCAPLASQKRKRQMIVQQPVKRTKKNTSIDDDVIVCEEISSDTGAQNATAEMSPISKSTPTADSAEKKKKKKKKKKLNKLADTSEQMVKSPSSSNKTRLGVQIQDLVVGRGPEAIYGKMVHIFYVGRLQNKTIFDSRTPGKKPLSFKLGKDMVIRGLDIGLEGMKVGGKRKLIVPPELGYGGAKVLNIPPNSTLEFTVELQAVS